LSLKKFAEKCALISSEPKMALNATRPARSGLAFVLRKLRRVNYTAATGLEPFHEPLDSKMRKRVKDDRSKSLDVLWPSI